ncbi:eukaryotic translation initiation factor 3 subunit H [Corchorus olitorius]|uniref:Eukaryotic translation initiation factor 3 subunit H n=1 Tax=Corchorus olitorius TaxID=93759 RepID=A0A1R3H8P9_9ROSI|nr:eukaryotic translation initiation factor 3 subunit H [Corchorus olitorius]
MASSTRRSYQVAATEEVLVILKIIKHCKQFSPAIVTDQLLGLDVGSILEVTNCFPSPIQMMTSLREVNVDNNTVGWSSLSLTLIRFFPKNFLCSSPFFFNDSPLTRTILSSSPRIV